MILDIVRVLSGLHVLIFIHSVAMRIKGCVRLQGEVKVCIKSPRFLICCHCSWVSNNDELLLFKTHKNRYRDIVEIRNRY